MRDGPGSCATAAGPLAAYRRKCAEGLLEPDPAQQLAAEKLQSLHNALARPAGRGGWRERLGLHRRAEPAAQGLYVFGGVGTGKSMLMDLFFAGAPVERKRRVHFHAFMLEVHRALHRGRQESSGDPIPPLARAIAGETQLLCFDELQVQDIADAMLLGRLFESLLGEGLVMVATSNYAPDDLYRDGLQRESFLPFIALLKERLDVLALDGTTDYRRRRIRGLEVYRTPLGADSTAALGAAFARLTDDAAPAPVTLAVEGRRLEVLRAAKGVAFFHFDQLCRSPLGPADFLAIGRHFHTLVLDGVPRLGPDERNEARRFITLVDELYEHGCKLVVAAADHPDRLYPEGQGAFDFRRTASRLMEMQSPEYLAREHLA
ncbi:MAG TPA: cell division protein ZapE [Dongiaceae bacterium]|nr:cell division protein ZapE [Dongiaceae bacterium]